MPTSLNAITQNDKIIASAVENNFNFLLTNFQSGTAPSNPSNGQLWYDSANNLLKVYVTSSTSWVTIGPAGSSTTVTVSDTPPGSPSAGDLWFDTGTSLRLYVFTTASGGAWLDANPASTGTSGGSGVLNQQVFTSSGSFTVPAGITKVYVWVFGGGGGGSGSSYTDFGYVAGTGGPGGSGQALITGLTPGQVITVTVGSGGNGGNGAFYSFPSNGTAGGTTSFGSYASATGGGAGVAIEQNIMTGATGIFTTTGTVILKNLGTQYLGGGNYATGGAGNGGTGLGPGGPGYSGGGGSGGFVAQTGGVASGGGNAGSNGSSQNGGAGGSPGGTGGTGYDPYGGYGGGGGGGGGVIVRW